LNAEVVITLEISSLVLKDCVYVIYGENQQPTAFYATAHQVVESCLRVRRLKIKVHENAN